MGKLRRDSGTGHTGVYRDGKYWQGRIIRDGKVMFQKNFATREEAIAARASKLLEIDGTQPEPPEFPLTVIGARWIRLTQGKFAIIDAPDFARVSQFNWFYTEGYARTHPGSGPRSSITLDRLILNPPEGLEPDHVDRDPLNCRRGNLRAATHHENMLNRGANKNNTSGYRGVSWHKQAKKWAAQVSIGRKHISLGLFASAEEAARVRDAWIRSHHGPFASLNFPGPPERPE